MDWSEYFTENVLCTIFRVYAEMMHKKNLERAGEVENTLLIREVEGQWTHWFELTESIQ